MSAPQPASGPMATRVLVVLLAAEFLVNVDNTIINVALPSIQDDLGFSQRDLPWVVNAYVVLFGGFLLLGGRAADLFGRRRVFVAGVALFTMASLACGLANSETWLVLARGVQGLGAALAAPAGLALITSTFREERQRTRALAAFGAVAGAGSILGLLLGGLLTSALSWQWVFFINLPIGVAVIAFARRVVPESRSERSGPPDVLGALLGTAGLLTLVYALVNAEEWGWDAARTLVLLGVAATLLAAFLYGERTAPAPLVRLGIFVNRNVAGGNLTTLLFGAAQFGLFFFLALYLQQVLGFSAIEAGLGTLAVALPYGISTGVAQQLVNRHGVLAPLVPGLLLLAGGQLWLSALAVDGSYFADVFGPLLLTGFGLGLTYVPLSISAAAGVERDESGMAAGLFTSSLQVGGALGLAVLSTIAAARTDSAGATGAAPPSALVEGFQAALLVSAALSVLGLLAALALLRVPRAEVLASAEPRDPSSLGEQP